MSNDRARTTKQELFNYKTTGCFGRYLVQNKLPIEFISTTMSMDEISQLSFAKDIRTKLDFELLIQRDIDKKRAIESIGKYISPDPESAFNSKENNGIFLPPLIAALVDTQGNKDLSVSYPDCQPDLITDEYGETYKRTWGALFEISLYEDPNGTPYIHDQNGESKEVKINLKHATFSAKLGRDVDSGGRLVVIDGQHRLYALKELMRSDEHKDKIKNLVIPVCIVYSPESTQTNVSDGTPSIPDVLRKLFIDVNTNAMSVSGHFRILLANDDVGQMLCNSLCSLLLNENVTNGGSKLALVEWNTKTDKESKTISKRYTISSIGVIYDALKDLFTTKNGLSILEYLLHIEEIRHEFDFGLTDENEPAPQSKDFPWRDIPYANRDQIKNQIAKYISPCIQAIFFDTPAYFQLAEIFEREKKSLESEATERNSDALYAQIVLDYLNQFDALDNQKAIARYESFVENVDEAYMGSTIPQIIRYNVFQKGLLTAWFSMLELGQRLNLAPMVVTKLFIRILQHSLDLGVFENDLRHQYLQETIYDGIRIRPSKESRKQISRLILAPLGNDKFSKSIAEDAAKLDIGVPEEQLKNSLVKLGDSSATIYLNSLHTQLVKSFSKEYRSRGDLGANEIATLLELEKRKDETKKLKRNDKSIIIDNNFDLKIREHIKQDFELGKEQLDDAIEYTTVCDELMQDNSDDGNEE
ncbi:hypothetical protein [Pseudidiomarina donghaiensis]|jgi:hypothetical protein|uniref:hypothetical protein n=1 Tax=Pseudidiomarina donghaiensis TaxID=519452 RepID=UPI003A96C6B9